MITLTVISFNGAPPASSLSAAFDELGGTIGRADTNQFVLPDPDRTISRVHAQLVYRNGGFAVVDKGSNAVLVNGKALGHGKEAPIKDGDWLQIGGYQIEVRAGGAGGGGARANDPFADLLGPAPAAPAKGALPASFDPLALTPPAAPVARSSDPFAAFAAPSGPGSAAAAPAAAGGIPDDWDPFAAPAPKPGAPDMGRAFGGGFGLDATGGAPAPLIPDLPTAPATGGGDSLDSLFGLKPGAVGDPFGQSALNAAAALPNMAASADPMASLKAVPRASAATLPDQFSDLNRPFLPPEPLAAPAPRPAPPPAPVAAPVAAPAERPAGAVMSWDDAGTEGRTVIRARAPVAPRATPASPAAPAPVAEAGADPLAAFGFDAQPASPPPIAAPVAAAVPTPAPASPAGDAAAVQALLAAFREGLATPTVPVEALTPALMKLIGELLRESASGTVDLLVARAALKREIRAESTMIVAKENNPLKFSPSAEAALGHLLAPPTRGFMPAAPAMRDAYDDLRAHQYGFVAGMRAALEGVLERFDPARLEGTLTQRSALQAILPAARKARLWESFNELYAQIRGEAQDDFHTVFGKAFLKAYEEHIDQLQSRGRG